MTDTKPTPQTDAIDTYQPFIVSEPKYNAMAELCRTLERELAAIKSQQTEPVAWKFRMYDAAYDEVTEHFTDDINVAKRHDQFPEPLYTAPQSGVREGMRVLREEDSYCPECGHNRDKSSISTITLPDGRHQCQKCSATWMESPTRAADQVNTDAAERMGTNGRSGGLEP